MRRSCSYDKADEVSADPRRLPPSAPVVGAPHGFPWACVVRPCLLERSGGWRPDLLARARKQGVVLLTAVLVQHVMPHRLLHEGGHTLLVA